MNRQRLAVVVGLVVAASVVLALAAGGIGPFPEGGGVDDSPTATPTPTTDVDDGAAAGGSGSGGGDGGDGAEDGGTAGEEPPRRPFALRIESIESCGRTCRDVTATLANQQDRRATGVTVDTRIHAGNGTDGDVVWEGTHEVGALGAGHSDTETQRVELGYFDAIAVQQEDGWVTILVSVDTDRQAVTFRLRRDVT